MIYYGFIADTLRFTSALSLVLAFVFLVITAGIVITKFYRGGLMKPRLYPNVTDLSSVWKLFTVVPVLVNAYICHSNGNASFSLKGLNRNSWFFDVFSPQYTERA